ncbi:MAG: YbbR-like domain-containing protein [Chloroflexota bacterium]
MSWLWRLIFGNWPLKLAALGLATVLYAGVALSDSTRSWSGPVPIEVLNAPVGGSLLELPGVVDEIRYRAPQEISSQLTVGSFRASIDLSAIEPRLGAEPVPVAVDVFPVDPRVRVVDHSPRSVNVRLDQVLTRGMPVIIDPGAIPEGIELGPVISEPNSITVRGASSRIQSVRTVEGRVPIDASGINIDQDVAMEAFDELGALVPGVEIEPASVRVTIDVARQLAYATLPVLAELRGEPARGRRVDNVSVVPATITVSGEDPSVRQLESISTEPVDISGLDIELVVEVPLVLPEEVTTAADSTATVFVTFTVDDGSRTLELGTALVGASADLTYRVEDPAVSVTVAGPLTLLDELVVGELIVEVPVASLEVGDHAVPPLVQLPRGLEIVRTIPETVRVTVGQPS